MRPLPWSQAATIAAACAWALGATALIGSLRLLPWLLRPEVPWEVAAPFAEAVGAKATETALLLGLPIGSALAAAHLVRKRTRPQLTVALFPTLAALGLFLVGANWRADASEPGRVAIGLLEKTRDSCKGAEAPTGAAVPMVGMSWLCFPGAEPRVVGMLPGSGGRVWFSAARLEPDPDLSGLTLGDFRLSGDAAPYLSSATLHVNQARVVGLPPWGRPTKLGAPLRAGLLAAAAWFIALVATFGMLRVSLRHRGAALFIGALPALLVVTLVQHLDAGTAGPQMYALLPLLGLAAAVATALTASEVLRWLPR